MSEEFNSIDEFLGHSGSSGRNRYLRDWKKKGFINIWLHTRRLPLANWAHNFPQLVVFEDKETRATTKAYWGRPINCWEDESFLKVQYKRAPDGQLEEAKPGKCSMCRVVDEIHLAIHNGELDWLDEVFRFEGSTDPKNDQVLYAGGVTGLFNSDKLTDKQKAELRVKGISQRDTWRQNGHAKLSYVFALVDQDDVRAGVQIATQNQLIGDRVKKVIRDTQASLGDEEGNPMLNPFCVQLTYDENAPINNMYHARRIEKHKLSPEIERLIRSDPPDLRGSLRKFNQRTQRAFLERHASVDLPWDRIFDVPMLEGDDDGEDADTSVPTTEERQAPARKSVGGVEALAPAPKAPPPPPSSRRVMMIPCEGCKKPMAEDARKCGNCGATYSFDEDEEEKPAVKGKSTGDKLPFDKF